MNRGEIWWNRLPGTGAAKTVNRRPVLIVQSDSFNRSNINTVICAIITSDTKLSKAPGNLLLKKEETNLPKDSVVDVSRVVTLDKSLLTKCAGSIDKRMLRKVDMGMRLVLDL